jgi:hypothetical protein
LYAAPGALGGVLAYVGLNYDKLETWVTEIGTNMKDEQLMDAEAVSIQPRTAASWQHCKNYWTHFDLTT